MKLLLFLHFTVLLISKQCSNCRDNCREKQDISYEREDKLIREYHEQVVISKGKEAFFIPKEEISWYFNNGEFLDINKAKIDDNVSFFDTLGNIEYQAIVVDIRNKKIFIRCKDLKNAKYYNTELIVDSVRDLTKKYPYVIKVYRFK